MRRAFCVLAGALLLASAIPARSQTQAGTTPLQLPCAVAYDRQGNLIFAERGGHVVRRISSGGVLTTIAGTGTEGFSGDGGPGVSAELDSPCGVAVDSSGDIYIADTRNNRVREVVATSGLISTVAGAGDPGFSGDGGPAIAAELDAPTGLVIDVSGNLYISDSGNHRVRRVSSDQIIQTIAGSGVQGFSGDGGPAISAALDSPSGLALDAAGNLLIADTRNHRIREVSASTGLIQSIAGTGGSGPGLPSFAGDGGAASSATLALPRGVAVDSSGNIYISDTADQRVRVIDTATGLITTVGGAGVEGFAGDNGAAAAANLDAPRSLAVTTSGLVTFADTANDRIRQIDLTTTPAPVIRTIAGLGTQLSTGGLVLSGPSVMSYGEGSITATLSAGSSATGSVTFLDGSNASPIRLGVVPLTNGTAILSTANLAAGSHSVSASYPGDITHGAAQSQVLGVTVTPLAITATAQPITILYGQPVPSVTGTLTGILPQDASEVSASFDTAATALSSAGSYPISAVLSGPAAANYTVGSVSAAVTIAKAPTIVTLTQSGAGVLNVRAASSTTGTPTGTVTLLDGGVTLTSVSLIEGQASYASASLATGTHSITAFYSGDPDFLAGSSSALTLGSTVGNTTQADFALTLTGPASQAIPSGSAAVYSFAITPPAAGLSSPVELTVSGIPPGATASFNPAYLPPSNAVTSVTLTVQTTKAASLAPPPTSTDSGGIQIAGLLGAFLGIGVFRRRRWGVGWSTTFPLREVIVASASCIVFATLASGCSSRVNVGTEAQSAPTYTLTVTGTATSVSGTPIQHSVSVTLQVL